MTRRTCAHNCAYCGRPLSPRSYWLAPTDDHIVPYTLGGWVTTKACRACNALKADMNPFDWQDFMENVHDWYKLVHITTLRGYQLTTRYSFDTLNKMIETEPKRRLR